MILSFKTTYQGKPTQFPEKILAGTKIHSLRQDPHDRWHEGIRIDMATGVRTKHYNCFHRTPCTGIQIAELSNHPKVQIKVDGRVLIPSETHEFARNDGFDSLEAFIAWWYPLVEHELRFQRPLRRKIIHWTDFRY